MGVISSFQLQKQIKEESDKAKKRSLANKYIKLYKTKKNVIALADAYYFLSESFSHSKIAIAYADSIIQITQQLKNDRYPTEGYLQKGIQLYYIADYDRALKNYLKADEYYKKQKNNFKQLVIKHYIGLLKNNINESDEAFLIFKENIVFFEKIKNQEKYTKQYLKSLFALTNAYIISSKLDSAEFYSKKGIQISLKEKNKYLYPHFLLSYGNTKMLQKDYKKSLDSILKGCAMITDKKISLCTNYIHISSIYDSLNNKSKSLQYLYKVDSIYQKEPQVIFRARQAYEILLRKYQEEGIIDKQLEIIKQLLSVDNLIKERPQNLSRKIVEQYDTPRLIYEKEKLIKTLEKQKSLGKTTIVLLGLLSVFLVIGTIYFARRNFINRKRFKALIANQQTKGKSGTNINVNKKELHKKARDLPDNVIKSILDRLDNFEKSKKFVAKQYTLSSLAKELNTNSAYLSKIINTEKKTAFAHYINNLRIDYAITKLKEDNVLRSYTIKAIANEFGFNTAQSFSSAFYKKTGIYPSFFLKQLQKHIDH